MIKKILDSLKACRNKLNFKEQQHSHKHFNNYKKLSSGKRSITGHVKIQQNGRTMK